MAMRRVGLHVLAGLVTLGVVTSAAGAQGIRFGQNRVNISATPRRLPADGQTVSRVRIEVRGRDNAPVPNGTEVDISTDIGDLVSEFGTKQRHTRVPTEGGFAIVLLTSEEPGTATIRASFQDSRNQVMVEFSPLDEKGVRDSTVIHIRGDWVGYSSELNVVEAWDAEVRYRGIVVEADKVRIDPRSLTLRAVGEIRMSRNDEAVECEQLYIELRSMRGSYRRFGDEGVEEAEFNAWTLKPSSAEQQLPEDAYRFDDQESQIWMVAKSISIFPGEKVVLRHGKVFVGPRKILTYPPYWVIAFEGYYGSSNSHFAELSSTGGLAIDFPFFFSVTDTTTHAIKIQKGARNGSIMARDKWGIAYERAWQELGGDSEGSFVIDGLPHKDWGVHLQHRGKMFGGADSSLSVAWPDHRSLFTDFSVFKYGSAGHYGVRTHADRQGDSGMFSWGTNADFLSNARPWGDLGRFRWGTGVRAGRDAWSGDGFVFQHSMSSYFDFNGWRPNTKTSLTPSISNVFSWDTASRQSNIARAQLMLRHQVMDGVTANVRYGLEHRSGTNRFYSSASDSPINQQVSLNVSAYRSKTWDAYANANYGITNESLYGFGAFNYRPWDKWRLGLIGSYYEFSGSAFNDVEVSMNRAIGAREVGLRWSKADGRISLEFGAAGF